MMTKYYSKYGVKVMYQIAICDDEKETLDYISKNIIEGFEKILVPVFYDSFTDESKLLKMFSENYHYDAVFLDIDMPKVNGIEVCRKIKEISPECLCIFISNKEELVFQSFEVQPFRFVRKTDLSNELTRLVKSISDEWKSRSRKVLQFTEKDSGDIFSFDLMQILYIEAQSKKIKIFTNLKETTIKMKLMDAEKILLPYNFLKPHRSYLINARYIFHIQKESVVLTNGNSIPLSRNRAEEFKKSFINFINEGV